MLWKSVDDQRHGISTGESVRSVLTTKPGGSGSDCFEAARFRRHMGER